MVNHMKCFLKLITKLFCFQGNLVIKIINKNRMIKIKQGHHLSTFFSHKKLEKADFMHHLINSLLKSYHV